jgi:hypothetical protein
LNAEWIAGRIKFLVGVDLKGGSAESDIPDDVAGPALVIVGLEGQKQRRVDRRSPGSLSTKEFEASLAG